MPDSVHTSRLEIPAKIRAARIHEFGPPDCLRIEEIDTPRPGPGEVLVRVAFAGLNPLDYKQRDGSSPSAQQLTLPAVLGRELAGTVLDAGEGVDLDALGLPGGTTVFGARPVTDPRGCYAQAVVIAAGDLAPVPPGADGSVPDGEALAPFGGLALAGVTALTAVRLARVGPGDTVLVHGGSGGVGQLILPLLVQAGAGRIWATGRAENALRIAELGATPIPYDEADWQQVIREGTGGHGVDVVIDTHYFATFEPSLDHLAPGGRIVVLPSLADLSAATDRGIEAHIPRIDPTREDLDELAAQYSRGTLPLELSEILPLADVARGHEQLQGGHTRGKLVLAL